jgi:Ca2+-binding RTX toxin-like protein
MSATDFPSTIDGGDGADRVSAGPQADNVRGGPGNDTLTGNGGRDTLRGEDGDDVINAADALPDWVSCGAGIDAVTADLIDTVAEDCEQINIGPGQPPLVILREPPAASFAALRMRGLRADLTCPATCSARSDLLLPAHAANRRAGASRRLLGTGSAQRTGAGRLTIVAHLKRGAARRLRRLRPLWLSVRTTVNIGASTTILQRRVRLR